MLQIGTLALCVVVGADALQSAESMTFADFNTTGLDRQKEATTLPQKANVPFNSC